MTKKAVQLETRFNAKVENDQDIEPMYHKCAFTHPLWPVITTEEPDTIKLYSWGLIPHWTKIKAMEGDQNFILRLKELNKSRNNTLNAKSETVFEKPSFRFSIKNKRCLVVSTGFYEWEDFNNKKYPYFITLKDVDTFCMAGIYQHWTDQVTAHEYSTFSILTTRANPMMEKIHNIKKRMPVILDPDTEKEWIQPELDPKAFAYFFEPYDQSKMKAHTISRLITSTNESSNVPMVQEHCIYSELSPLLL